MFDSTLGRSVAGNVVNIGSACDIRQPQMQSTITTLTWSFLAPAGNFLNIGSDWYKAGAKKSGAGLVATGPYIHSMRPNYLGDWLR